MQQDKLVKEFNNKTYIWWTDVPESVVYQNGTAVYYQRGCVTFKYDHAILEEPSNPDISSEKIKGIYIEEGFADPYPTCTTVKGLSCSWS